MSGDGSKMAAANWNGFWRNQGSVWTSLDSGASWKQVSIGQPAQLIASGNGSKLFAVSGEFGDGIMSLDWGASWSQTLVYFASAVAASYDGTKWFARGSTAFNTIVCSGDGGLTWGYIDQMRIEAITMASSGDGSIVYAATSSGDLLTWQERSLHLTTGIDTNAIILTWPSHRLSMRMEQTSTLKSNEWTEISTQPTLTNRVFRYVTQPAADKAFFRLKAP